MGVNLIFVGRDSKRSRLHFDDLIFGALTSLKCGTKIAIHLRSNLTYASLGMVSGWGMLAYFCCGRIFDF